MRGGECHRCAHDRAGFKSAAPSGAHRQAYTGMRVTRQARADPPAGGPVAPTHERTYKVGYVSDVFTGEERCTHSISHRLVGEYERQKELCVGVG